jgi:hypothetical protein
MGPETRIEKSSRLVGTLPNGASEYLLDVSITASSLLNGSIVGEHENRVSLLRWPSFVLMHLPHVDLTGAYRPTVCHGMPLSAPVVSRFQLRVAHLSPYG